MRKINHILAHGLFFLTLSTQLMPVLTTMSSTLPWADFGERFKGFNVEIDEDKYRRIGVIATAYSSTVDQTDDTPFITAANTRARDGIVAANFLKLHTRIRIPDLYGDKIFTVEDRMHSRFNDARPPRIDIWLPDRHLARQFGVQKVDIVIVD